LIAITRAYTLIYTLSLLTLLTRIQLNLLGRRSYLSSVISLAHAPSSSSSPISLENHEDGAAQAYGNDFETNRRYLTFSWWLLHRGWQLVQANVEAAVKEVFNPLSLREDVTIEKLAPLILDIRRRVEGSTDEDRKAKKWLPYLLPPRDQEEIVLAKSGMQPTPQSPPSVSPSSPTSNQATLRRLLDETADLIDSPPFSYVHTLLLDAGFTQLSEALTEEAFQTEPVDKESIVQDVTSSMDAKVKLAAVLAVVTRQAHQVGNGVPNLYLQAMENVGELEAFAAVVYSNQWEAEGNQEKGKEKEPKPEEHEGQDVGGEPSVLVAESGFESAWGKAVDKVVATAPAA
jgi:peroxin-3